MKNIAEQLHKILPDECLCDLIKLRLNNEGFMDQDNIKITNVKIETRTQDGFTAIIKTNRCADHATGMIFTKFYPDEFAWLLTHGAIFTTEWGTLKN